MRRLQDVQPTYLQTHLVQLKVCPEAIRAKYIQNVAKGKTAEKRSGKRAADDIAAAAEDMGAQAKPEAKAARRGMEDLRSFSERKLTPEEIRAVDVKLARFCYSEGLSFKSLANKELRGALRKLNSSWASRSKMSPAPFEEGALPASLGHLKA